MPDERTPAGAPTSEPFVPPAQIDEGTWGELFPGKQTAAKPSEPAPEPEPSALQAAAAPAADPSLAAQQTVAQMLPQIAAQVAALQGQGQTQRQSEKSVEDIVVDELVVKAGAGANEAAIREMVKTMVRVAQDQTNPKIQTLERQVQALTEAQSRQAGDRTLQQFEALIERRCVESGITSAFDKSSMRAMVIQEGMKQHGSSFDMAKADRLFRQLNSERVKNRGTAPVKDTPAKQAKDEPPVKGSTGNSSAVEGIRQGLSNPKQKGWGFRGKNFQSVVRQHIERALG